MMKHRWIALCSACLLLGGCFFLKDEAGSGPDGSEISSDQVNADEINPVERSRTEQTLDDPLLGSFYRDQLSVPQRELYDRMAEGILQGEMTYTLKDLDREDLACVWVALTSDHPEFFWLNQYTYLLNNDGNDYLRLVDEPDPQEVAAIEQAADAIIDAMPSGLDEAQRAEYLYRLLIDQTVYDSASENNQDIRSVLLNGTSVCAGYAKAYELLCRKAGVGCTIVSGQALPFDEDEATAHSWNLMKVNGEYCWSDVTWGDQEPENNPEGYTMSYLMVPDDVIYARHCFDNTLQMQDTAIPNIFTMPAANDSSLSWYARNNLCFDYYDREQMSALIDQTLSVDNPRVEVQFSNDQAYREAIDDLRRQDDNLYFDKGWQIYGWSETIAVSYIDFDDARSIIFWITPV